MSHSRFTPSLVALAIFFANACCLAHLTPQYAVQSATKVVHACCHKAMTTESQGQKSQAPHTCECCQRVDATIDSGAASHHAPLALVWHAIVPPTVDILLPVSFCSTFHFDSQAPPGVSNVLQQSCSLIL